MLDKDVQCPKSQYGQLKKVNKTLMSKLKQIKVTVNLL